MPMKAPKGAFVGKSLVSFCMTYFEILIIIILLLPHVKITALTVTD